MRLLLFAFIVWASSTTSFAQDSIKESEQLDFAQGLLTRGMYDLAINQYQKFITDYPHSSLLQQAYLYLGEGYFLSNDLDKAMSTFNQFKQLYPSSDQMPIIALRQGQIDLQLKKYDDALNAFNSVDAQKQLKGAMLQSFDFYTAQAYLGKSDTPNALKFFQMASQVPDALDYTAYAFNEIGKIQIQQANFAQALDAYTQGLAHTQGNALKAELTYRLAEAQFMAGHFADAVKGFQLVLDRYQGKGYDQDALANQLLAYFNLGQYGQLLDIYEQKNKLIKNDDTYFAIHMSAVLALIELKKYDRASALLDQMLKITGLQPNEQARIYIKKADILIRQIKYKDALALLDANASADNNDADEISFLRGQANYGLGDYDHAFSFYENVVSNFTQSRFFFAALLGQAHARQKTGRFKEAEGLFMKYYGMQNDVALKGDALYDAVVMAVKAGDASGVVTSGQQYLKDYPTGEHYTDVLLLLAENEGKNNQPKDAAQLLQGYLSAPQAPARTNAAYFLLGFNQQLAGNSDKALAAYAQVDPNKDEGQFYPAALKNMAIIYLTQKNYDQARVCFDKLMGQSNDLQIKTYIWVANEYLKKQKYDDVLRVADEAQKNFPASQMAEINYFRAEALRGLGRCTEAIQEYELVAASGSRDAYTGSAHIGEGLCLEQTQKFDEAKAQFQKSLDENGDDYTVTAHATFEMANADAAQSNFEDALRYYLLVATIYDDDYYCSQSLLKAAGIFERLKRRPDALKMYQEIIDKYKGTAAFRDAQERMKVLQ